jgi:hypothetical protein
MSVKLGGPKYDRGAIVAKHVDERLADCSVRGVASLLGEEASGGHPINQPERFLTHVAVLLRDLVERDERCVPRHLVAALHFFHPSIDH